MIAFKLIIKYIILIIMDKNYFSSTKVGFIGGGNMASAIGAGLIHKGKRIL